MYKIAEDDLYWDELDNVIDITKDFLEPFLRIYRGFGAIIKQDEKF